MHETGLIRGLVQAARAAAWARGGGRITRVSVRVGALAGISPGHLRDHWREEAAGTELDGAELAVEASDDPTDDDAMHVMLEWVELAQPGQR